MKTKLGLTEVPMDIPVSAQVVDLYSNATNYIRDGTFSHLSLCTKLWLDDNRLYQINGDTFKGLYSLKYLGLGNNDSNSIKSGAFSYLAALTELILWKNKLTELKNEMFVGLKSLKKLNLLLPLPGSAMCNGLI